jgi:hypothetical protein
VFKVKEVLSCAIKFNPKQHKSSEQLLRADDVRRPVTLTARDLTVGFIRSVSTVLLSITDEHSGDALFGGGSYAPEASDRTLALVALFIGAVVTIGHSVTS